MKKIIFLFILIPLTIISCKEEEKVLGPCKGFLWAKASIDGREVCFENIRLVYQNANTKDAYIQLTIDNGLIGIDESINGFFSVPVEGITLNTAFPAYDGDYFQSEEMVSGSLTYIYYDTTAPNKDDRYAHGFFELVTQNLNNTSSQTQISGEFIYNF